ncbi:SUMO-targeted ubiquitin ligase complex subunit slx8 [Lignoscripta atroalba]|nr:SUMO-targeted ubiquitin ligase complex subunit slx8 [Lignoscripta atroalba]
MDRVLESREDEVDEEFRLEEKFFPGGYMLSILHTHLPTSNPLEDGEVMTGSLEFPLGITQFLPLLVNIPSMSDPDFFSGSSPVELALSPSLEFRSAPWTWETTTDGVENLPSASRSGFIDLTDERSLSAMATQTPRRRPSPGYVSRPSSSDEPTTTKRRRIGTGEAKPGTSEKVEAKIEEVDLREVDDDDRLARLLEQQRASTIKAQLGDSNKPLSLSTLQCVVCMEDMTDITSTHCGKAPSPISLPHDYELTLSEGHLFCHTCLMEALIAGEIQGPDPGKGLSRCPVCRKKVVRAKEGKDPRMVIPLEIKLQGKPSSGKGKEKATAVE